MTIEFFKCFCITRGRLYPEEEGKKPSETSITGNKITQDPDNLSKEAKVGSSIDGTKFL